MQKRKAAAQILDAVGTVIAGSDKQRQTLFKVLVQYPSVYTYVTSVLLLTWCICNTIG